MKASISFRKISIKLLIALVLVLPFVYSGINVFVPTQEVYAETLDEREKRLQQELAALEKELAALDASLVKQKQQTGSLQRDLSVLQTEIKQKRLEIEKKNKLIKNLAGEIAQKGKVIGDLNEELTREQASMGRILRNMNEVEEYSFTEFMASSKTVSEMFGDLDLFEHLQGLLQKSSQTIESLKEKTALEKQLLEKKKNDEADVKYALEQDRKKVEQKEGEKKTLVQVSKTQEKSYEQVIAERKAQAAKIRAALFELRGQSGISFGDAYEYAKIAGNKTGVRPAYILAILKQESNLGKNVGTCNRPGDKLTWRDIMPGPTSGSWRDDQTIYLAITSKLGIKPDGQPLSCPIIIGGKPSGWGGAMGPSQFIPATWKSYEARIAQTVGASVANPWNPSHAITATALYVKDLGAAGKTYTAEREAACKYYSGRGCSTPGVQNAFYGNAVMSHAEAIQAQIDVLESV